MKEASCMSALTHGMLRMSCSIVNGCMLLGRCFLLNIRLSMDCRQKKINVNRDPKYINTRKVQIYIYKFMYLHFMKDLKIVEQSR